MIDYLVQYTNTVMGIIKTKTKKQPQINININLRNIVLVLRKANPPPLLILCSIPSMMKKIYIILLVQRNTNTYYCDNKVQYWKQPGVYIIRC